MVDHSPLSPDDYRRAIANRSDKDVLDQVVSAMQDQQKELSYHDGQVMQVLIDRLIVIRDKLPA